MTAPPLRLCPHCARLIRWQDFSGLPIQSWHYADSIIQQGVIAGPVEWPTIGVAITGTTAPAILREEIEHPTFPPFQKCGYCKGLLNGQP